MRYFTKARFVFLRKSTIRGVRESQWRGLDGKDLRIKISETVDGVKVFAIEEREARRRIHVIFESDDFKRKLNESF